MIDQLRGPLLKWVAGIGGCLVIVVALGAWMLFGGLPYQGSEQQNVELVVQAIDHLMQAGLKRDVSAAARHVASQPSPELMPNALVTLFATRRDLFDGYRGIDQNRYGVTLVTGWRGTRASLSGNISYSDRENQPFQAELVKGNNQWRLVSITFLPVQHMP